MYNVLDDCVPSEYDCECGAAAGDAKRAEDRQSECKTGFERYSRANNRRTVNTELHHKLQSPVSPLYNHAYPHSIATHRIHNKIINEPRQADRREGPPVALDDQRIRDLRVLHRVAPEARRLLHVQPPDEDEEGGDDAEAEREAPDRAEVVFAETALLIK